MVVRTENPPVKNPPGLDLKQKTVITLTKAVAECRNLEFFLFEACSRAQETLGAEMSGIWEVDSDRGECHLREGQGWPAGGGEHLLPFGPGTETEYAKKAGIYITGDMETETRLPVSPFFKNQNVRSAILVPILGKKERLFGFMGIFSSFKREWQDGDIQFLEAVGQLVQAGVRRHEYEKSFLDAQERMFRKLKERPSAEKNGFFAHRDMLEHAEKEKKSMGQKLHEGLAQDLAGLSYMIMDLYQKLRRKGLEESEASRHILESIQNIIRDTRSMARSFYPVELDCIGLTKTIRDFAAGIESVYGVRCTCHAGDVTMSLDPQNAIHLYRIIREGVLFLIETAGAHEMDLMIFHTQEAWICCLYDDGKEWLSQKAIEEGALRSMQCRAELIGATLDVRREPGKGSRFILKMAISQNERQSNRHVRQLEMI